MNSRTSGPKLPIPPELYVEWPDPHRLRNQLLSLYEKDSGQTLSRPHPTDNDLELVVRWLNENATEFLPFFGRPRTTRVPVFSPSLSAKVFALSQFHCPICETKDGLFPVCIIPIRITPASKQAMNKTPKKRAAFERAIRHHFANEQNPFSPDASICLLLVFVVKEKGAQKDLDNMAKALVDAVKNILFGDDSRIDHLNILRIKSPDEEFVYLNIRETQINSHSDVLVPRMLHSWAGLEILNFEDFVD